MSRNILVLFLFCMGMTCRLSAEASENRPGLCLKGQHWVKAHHRGEYIRADGVYFSAANVHAHCSGNPPGYESWLSMLKGGLPSSWPRSKEVGKKWTDEEGERFLEAISFIPVKLKPAIIEGIFRAQKSLDFPNPASNDKLGRIVLYDEAFSMGNNLSKILSHEFAHRHYDQMSIEEQDHYKFAAGWFNQGEDRSPDWTLLRKKSIETDSNESPQEDFANNVAAFLYNYDKLKEVSPAAYDWIAKHFGANFKLGKGSPK